MARRRPSVAPLTEIEVLRNEIADLRKQISTLRQPSHVSLQAEDWEETADPVPWQLQINHPGTHTPADPTDAAVYYHPGDVPIGGSTPPGFKRLAPVTDPRMSWVISHQSTPIYRAASGDPTLMTAYNAGYSDSDSTYLFKDGSNIPKIAGPGVYSIRAYVDFGAGGASTGDGYSCNAWVWYDINAAGGTPHDFRWGYIKGGSGVGSGAGPLGVIWREGSYPFADLDLKQRINSPNWTVSDWLFVSQLPTGVTVPINLFLGGVTNQAGDVQEDDAFIYGISVTRIGDVRSHIGGINYL